MMDIVRPKDNEKELISMAEKLGYDSLCLAYDKGFEKKKYDTKLNILYASIGKRSKYADFTIIDKPERTDFRKADIIIGLENMEKKDSLHYRRSGLNEVLCKIAKENNVFVAVNFNDLLRSKKRGLLLGRIMQNKDLCKKFKLQFNVYSFATKPLQMRHAKDFESFLRIL